MTPSRPMTDGQIEKAVNNYRAMLQQHRSEIGSSDAMQQVLGSPQYLAEQLAVIRKRVEAMSNLIVRRVKVDRMQTPQAVLDATGRKQYTNRAVVEAMPRGVGDEVEVYIFKVGRYLSDADLEKEYDLRGLTPVDPYALAAVNQADPALADNYPNGTHWKNAENQWCFAAFRRWDVGRYVYVDRYVYGWLGRWCFAGVRK